MTVGRVTFKIQKQNEKKRKEKVDGRGSLTHEEKI